MIERMHQPILSTPNIGSNRYLKTTLIHFNTQIFPIFAFFASSRVLL